MLYYSLIFLLIGLIAGALGLFGVAAIASQISWVLFLVGIILLVVHLVGARSFEDAVTAGLYSCLCSVTLQLLRLRGTKERHHEIRETA